MAKKNISTTFEHAIIDMADGTITEITKDGESTFRLADVLKEWDGVEEITLSIKKTSPIPVPSDAGGD